ncbi:MAG: Tn3 family transposase [Gammaproteobacteria bacterium]|nr:Tn3 family transposase [Gammaproteobacteria bacterium]
MTMEEDYPLNRRRYHPVSLPQEFSDEEMVRDWTLSEDDKSEIVKYSRNFRLFITIQLCAVRLYGRFLSEVHGISPRIVNHLCTQLDLPPSLNIEGPDRRATNAEHRKNILRYLGFHRFDGDAQIQLQSWIEEQARNGLLPGALFQQAECYLLNSQILLPGASVLERLIIRVCSEVHDEIFEKIYQQLPPDLRQAIEYLLSVPEGEQRSQFSQLKQYPPAASISSLQSYLGRFQILEKTGIGQFETHMLEPGFVDYLFNLAKRYSAKDIRQFGKQKRYALMLCFLLETRKILLDHLVMMHDQYVTEMCRESRNAYEKKHRESRKRHKKAVDTIIDTTDALLDWPVDKSVTREALWQQIDEIKLRQSLDDLRQFKRLEERGYGDALLARYPSMRKYFAQFIDLQFTAAQGSEALMQAIQIVREIDSGLLKKLPADAPIAFVPKELRKALKNPDGNINRNAWEMSLALALKEALRSGDLYLPQSKSHVFFWDMMLSKSRLQEVREAAYEALNQPQPTQTKAVLTQQFIEATSEARKRFKTDDFATIDKGKLKLKRYDKITLPASVTRLQKVIDASMPPIRIEQLLMEVDQLTQFTQHFTPIHDHQARPKHFYKTLISALISQATNLGPVAMSACVDGLTVDMLRHVLNHHIREETLNAASAEIVNKHHKLPLSAIHGSGTLSSSDAQRFKIRASSLLASYYPRYYGYYDKAIGIYTHVSDQYSVYSTKIISCSPREALYVLDGLLDNNTLLDIRAHTTDTHGYTEIIFALCHLLGFYFMPRIRDLKDQQLYRVNRDKNTDYGDFTPLLNKTVDLDLIEEQWEAMMHVVISLKQRTVPAHVIVQRLTNSYPSDRLSKAFTHLGRIVKTEYILRYITDPELRRTVQLQLNKGEYRHRLPRRIFFADQGEFTTGNYEEIMNKASSLSLVSNAVLYWNTLKIDGIIESLRQQGEVIDDEALSHISLLPYKHVLPNGTYFVDDAVEVYGDFAQKVTV